MNGCLYQGALVYPRPCFAVLFRCSFMLRVLCSRQAQATPARSKNYRGDTMVISANASAVALAFLFIAQESYGFHTTVVVASPARWLQPTAAKPTSSPHPTHQQTAWGATSSSRPSVFNSRRFTPPISMAAEDGGEAKGFSSSERKASRKSAKKAKARGGAPAFPVGKAAAQAPSKAVTAEAVQEARPGETADAKAARWERILGRGGWAPFLCVGGGEGERERGVAAWFMCLCVCCVVCAFSCFGEAAESFGINVSCVMCRCFAVFGCYFVGT